MAGLSALALAALPWPLASQSCPTLGWAEGLVNYVKPDAPFPTKDTAHQPGQSVPDCDFHQWSWEAFVWATAIDSETKVARFLTMPTEADFTQTRTKAGRATNLVLKPRGLKPKGSQQDTDSFEQTGPGGVLVDQNGQALFYAVHMNDTYFEFAQQYYGVAAYDKASPTLNFPVGSAVFKSAWQVVSDPKNPPTGFYVSTATVPILVNNPKGGVMADPTGATRQVSVALLGLHVVGVTENHPEFLWGTFEQVKNSPYLMDPNSPKSPNPVSTQGFTLYKGGTPAADCNQNIKPTVADASAQTLTPITNVFLQNQYGGADHESATDIANINSQAQSHVAKIPNQEPFASYALVGTVWLHENALQPGDADLNTIAVGSTALANSCMETFVQGTPATKQNCFVCHNTAGNMKYQFPGKNINISHVILGPLFNSPPAKARMLAPDKE